MYFNVTVLKILLSLTYNPLTVSLSSAQLLNVER